jgi:hypothetical protein
MATRQTTTKVRKKESVVPFKDELNFVVPKKGGFGQPDNENYVMVVGTTTVDAPDTPTSTGVELPTSTQTTTSTQIPVTSSGNPITTNTTTQQPTNTPPSEVPCTSYTYGSWSACQNGTQTRAYVGVPSGCVGVAPSSETQQNCTTSTNDETIQAQQDCIASGGAYINGVCVNNPSPRGGEVNTIPNFPVWDSLDCTTLKSKIAEYNATLSTSRFAQNVVDAYNTEIAKAQAIYNTKCPIKDETTAIIIPPNVGGVFGGGGFGEPPSDESGMTTEETSSNNKTTFLVLLGIVGLLYLLTRKK